MTRTRVALLDGARRAVVEHGTKLTMAQLAVSSGVAKATLYNHFRTRDAVLQALLEDEVRRLIEAALLHQNAVDGPGQALRETAAAISGNPVRAALARFEPALLVRLGHVPAPSTGPTDHSPAPSDPLDVVSSVPTTPSRVSGPLPTVALWQQARYAVRALLAPPAAIPGQGAVDPSHPDWTGANAGDSTSADRPAHGREVSETVLRWLASFLITPGSDEQIALDVAVLLATG